MALNQNGFVIPTWTLTNHHTKMTQGQLIGIVFGWIVGSIALYILGLIIIYFYFKRKSSLTNSSQTSDQNKSGQNNNIPKHEKTEEELMPRRRKIHDKNEIAGLQIVMMTMPQDSEKNNNMRRINNQ